MTTIYKNFSWRQDAKGNEDKCAEEQFMNFCNDLNDKGWVITLVTHVGNGKVVHCKTEPDGEFKNEGDQFP